MLPLRALCILALLVAAPAVAQTSPTPELGDRVRIHRAQGDPIAGRLIGHDADGLVITVAEDRPVQIAMADVTRIDRSLGTQRNFAKGFVPTVLAFAAVGAGIGAATWSPCRAEGWGCLVHFSRGEQAAMGAVGLGAVGLLVGAIVGANTKSERWQPVERPGVGTLLHAVRVAPSGRVGLTFTVPSNRIFR